MEKNIDLKLQPNELYWESIFSSFFKLKKLADYFTNLNHELKNEESPISKLFYDYFKRQKTIEECPQDLKNILISRNREDLYSEPTILFNYLIEELHQELKLLNNKKNNDEIKIESYLDENKAMENFYEYEKKNKSIIQKLFFGREKTVKKCNNCGRTSYKIDFLKYCSLNLKNTNGSVTIEDLYDNIQREFEKKYYCNNCKKEQNFKIKMNIDSNPEILIFFIYNHSSNLNIDFSKDFNIPNINYRIKSLVMGTDKSCSCLCCCKNNKDNNKEFISYGYEKGKYYKFENGDIKDINQKELLNGNPYIIFYQIKKEENNCNEIKKTEDSDLDSNEFLYKRNSDSENKNEIKEKNIELKKNNHSLSYNFNVNLNDKNYINNILSNSLQDKDSFTIKTSEGNERKKIKNISIISNNSNKNKNNKSIISSKNSNLDDEENLIRLYFRFNDGNILFIDVDNNITFENIIIELKAVYEWIKIDEDNLYFNDKKINKNDIPRKIGINQGNYIDVYSNLIDD